MVIFSHNREALVLEALVVSATTGAFNLAALLFNVRSKEM